MSNKLDSKLIKKYHRATNDAKAKGINYEGLILTVGLIFLGVIKLGGPVNAALVVGVLLGLYLPIKWMSAPNRPEDVGELSAEFRKDGIRIQATVDSLVELEDRIKLSDIKAIYGYTQDAWLWARERGILVETKQDKQYRLSLNLDQRGIENLLDDLQQRLIIFNYEFDKYRKFQP